MHRFSILDPFIFYIRCFSVLIYQQYFYDIIYLYLSCKFTLIAHITNMYSIYIVHSMIERLNLPASFLGRVYVRGVSSVNTWSPYFASVFLVVYSLNVPVYQYLPYGLLLSF